MPQLYLVKTTFKAGGKVFMAGSLLEDLSEVRLFKVRMNEGKLIPLPEGSDLDNLSHFFKDKYGIDLKEQVAAKRASKGSNSAEQKNHEASNPPPGTSGAPVEPLASGKPQPLSGSQTSANNTVKK